jgi:AraC-like DNA-binding protein
MKFHLVLSGSCYVKVNNKYVKLRKGDFILLPLGLEHSLISDEGAIEVNLKDLWLKETEKRFRTLNINGVGQQSKLICGGMNIDTSFVRDINTLLPEFILLNTNKDELSFSLDTIFNIIEKETENHQLGTQEVVNRLAEFVLSKTLQQFLTKTVATQNQPFDYEGDIGVRNAIVSMHKEPGATWNISVLANNANMSRTSFISKFKKVTGLTPIGYLTKLRIEMANKRLCDTNDRIKNIAYDFGYNSESSFARAFKQIMGVSPSYVRQNNT